MLFLVCLFACLGTRDFVLLFFPHSVLLKYSCCTAVVSLFTRDVREMEGIPDLEEESGNEVYKEVLKGKRTSSGESTRGSRAVPVHKRSGSSSISAMASVKAVQDQCNYVKVKAVPEQCLHRVVRKSNGKSLADQSAKGMASSISSPQTLAWKSVDEGSLKKKAAIFEVEGTSKHDAHPSPLSTCDCAITSCPPGFA
ncbi:UNVERIFIED_CONTAM: hypothetical protein Sindi_0302600 [Sesamum indicum]